MKSILEKNKLYIFWGCCLLIAITGAAFLPIFNGYLAAESTHPMSPKENLIYIVCYLSARAASFLIYLFCSYMLLAGIFSHNSQSEVKVSTSEKALTKNDQK